MLVKGKDRSGTAPYIGIFGSMPCVARTLSRSSVGFKRGFDFVWICLRFLIGDKLPLKPRFLLDPLHFSPPIPCVRKGVWAEQEVSVAWTRRRPRPRRRGDDAAMTGITG
jgi:hypothetical protein